ncbi:MAG: hypothetical protein ACPIOQ_43255, partial [Promethearchaeia archaeon]
ALTSMKGSNRNMKSKLDSTLLPRVCGRGVGAGELCGMLQGWLGQVFMRLTWRLGYLQRTRSRFLLASEP